ncbi:MAG: (Fe-S)-binding protein, partial [Candidatus Hydrothermarchaeota archaeon]
MAKITPLQIYKFLPGTNSKKCGEPTCMAFASKLIERKRRIDECPILDQPEYKEKKKGLVELMTPPVKEVVIGTGNSAIAVGGEEVMYR